MNKPRYAKALAAAKEGDEVSFGEEVHAAGYATDPTYPFKLSSVAKKVEGELV